MPYINISDVKMYYDVSGRGCPLLLLHGAAQTGSRWKDCIEFLSQDFTVIVPDLRGHGRTNNPSRRLSGDLVADDIAKFIEQMNLGPVLTWGFSFGCHVLLNLAVRRTSLFTALVAESCAATPSESLAKALERLKPELIEERAKSSELRTLEEQHLDWRQLYELVSTELAQKQCIKEADLKQITIPCLLLCGDKDPFFPLENIVRTYRHLLNAELFIVPNTGHGVEKKCSSLVGEIVIEFLKRHSTN